jgi:hypothetical protein
VPSSKIQSTYKKANRDFSIDIFTSLSLHKKEEDNNIEDSNIYYRYKGMNEEVYGTMALRLG